MNTIFIGGSNHGKKVPLNCKTVDYPSTILVMVEENKDFTNCEKYIPNPNDVVQTEQYKKYYIDDENTREIVYLHSDIDLTKTLKIIIDQLETIKDIPKLIDAIKAKDELLSSYRFNKTPSDKLFKKLEQARLIMNKYNQLTTNLL